jgi:Holliday junction resolvase RusA-like endonuclease
MNRYTLPLLITIPVVPVTKKNHSKIIHLRNGRHALIPSDPYKRYAHAAGWFLQPLGIDCPVNVKATYYMETRRIVDLPNLHAALHDIMKDNGTITDDNSNIIAGTDGSRVLYDKDNPRTEIEITAL